MKLCRTMVGSLLVLASFVMVVPARAYACEDGFLKGVRTGCEACRYQYETTVVNKVYSNEHGLVFPVEMWFVLSQPDPDLGFYGTFRDYQTRSKLSTNQMHSILTNIIVSMSGREEVYDWGLAVSAIMALPMFSDGNSNMSDRKLVAQTIGMRKKEDDHAFFSIPIDAYLLLVSNTITDVVMNILTNTVKFDGNCRGRVYDSLFKFWKTGDPVQRDRVVASLEKPFNMETALTTLVHIDRFLLSVKKGYADSRQRYEILNKIPYDIRTNDAYDAYGNLQKPFEKLDRKFK